MTYPDKSVVTQKDIVQKEVDRYQSKGRGAAVAILMVISLVYYFPKIAQVIWDMILNYMEKNNVSLVRVHFIAGYVQTWGISLPIQIFYGIVYYTEWSFFERYKVLQDPWPWKENRE